MTGLRDQLLVFLTHFASGPKAIRVQLCVSLAILAIQMKEWKDVLPTVVNALNSSHAAILDFLRVLPEEVTEGRKITLTVRDHYHHHHQNLGPASSANTSYSDKINTRSSLIISAASRLPSSPLYPITPFAT